jgi:hypothetical protein
MFMVVAKASAAVWAWPVRRAAFGGAAAADGVFPAFFAANATKRRKMLVFSNYLIDFR